MRKKFLILPALLFLCACAIKEPIGGPSSLATPSYDTTIPAGGNSWVLNDRNASRDLIKDHGIADWSDPNHRLGVFFHTAQTGLLHVAVRLRSAGGESRLKFSFGGESTEITLQNANWEIVPIGSFQVTQPGYQILFLQGLERSGATFAEVKEVLIGGPATRGAVHYVKDEFYWARRGPSVHLWYPPPPEAAEVEWFYNEITVPEGQDVLGSYFMANGFGEGYFGFQVNSATERRILFSVWSPFQTDDPSRIPEDQKITLLKKGENVYSGEFGNEGSGGQSYLQYPWRAGVTYRFLLRGRPAGGNATDYTAWFYAPEAGQWLLIASWRRPQTNTYLTGLYSFLENFYPETGATTRQARYGNQWIRDTRGQWHELTQARFTADATARKGNRLDYTGGVRNGVFFLKNCGFFNERTDIDTDFQRPATGKQPSVDLAGLP